MLTFDEATHSYQIDGVKVPSVTQVLDTYTDLSKIPRDVLERKRQIGQAVHKAIELDLLGDLDEDSIPDVWAGYFEGWRRFRAHSGFVCAQSEQRVGSKKYGYAGTLDLFGELHGKPSLIDAKTTTMLYPTVGPQTAAYAEANKTPKADRYALLLSKDGRYELAPLTDRTDWAVFQAALTIHHWRNKCRNN